TGSGNLLTLWEISEEISRRLAATFLRDQNGFRAVHGASDKFQCDAHWKDLILFYEYFHGDNGRGVGASHQTGWTGVVAKLLQQSGEKNFGRSHEDKIPVTAESQRSMTDQLPGGRRRPRSSERINPMKSQTANMKEFTTKARPMKAIAVRPGTPGSVHLAELARPLLDDVPNGRGVLVKVLRVGVDGTDKEINAAEYGAAPPGYGFLVLGHESLGRVEAVGTNVNELQPGDYVVATVRRPGTSIYDQIGTNDMTTDDTYFERGINLRHGYLTEYYVDDVEFIVKVPSGLKEVGVLLEPTTVVEKGIAQAYEIQRRLRVWKPRRAAVMGAGTIGLLATLVLRLRGLDVTTFALTPKPYLNSDLIEAIGARYVSTQETPIMDGAAKYGPFDLVFEA